MRGEEANEIVLAWARGHKCKSDGTSRPGHHLTRHWVETEARTKAGSRGRIVATRIDYFGLIAHAYVTFEDYVPGRAGAETQGVDSIELVSDREGWKVAGFTTRYEGAGLTLSRRFAVQQ